MELNQKCFKCGSAHVQLSNVESKHGCRWFILFGWLYLIWIPIKWVIWSVVFVCIDWWMAIIKKAQGKGYVWKSKRWFSGRKKRLTIAVIVPITLRGDFIYLYSCSASL